MLLSQNDTHGQFTYIEKPRSSLRNPLTIIIITSPTYNLVNRFLNFRKRKAENQLFLIGFKNMLWLLSLFM